jgi:hypothetical protein
VDNPILNQFRMAGMLRGSASQRRATLSPTRHEDEVAVLLWDYAQDDVPGPDASVSLDLGEFPKTPRLLVRHCRIDAVHSNAYAL